jgi:hypothetical protein
MNKKILYISGSLGLGHVIRDLAIANEMRRMCSGLDISWIAGSPATDVLASAGEKLLPEHAAYTCETDLAEAVSNNGKLSLTTYVFRALIAWFHNARLIGAAASHGGFDIIVGNEAYELPVTNFFGVKVLPPIPFVMMYDFWGMEVTSGNIIEKLGAWFINLIWSREWRLTARPGNAALFFGEIEDVPDRPFGFLLPDRRDRIKKHVEIVGYPLPFDIKKVPSKDSLRQELGYGSEPLVICTVGGTSIGRDLLELCGRAFPIIKQRIPDLHMVLIAGPPVVASPGYLRPGSRPGWGCDHTRSGGITCSLLVFPGGTSIRTGGNHR